MSHDTDRRCDCVYGHRPKVMELHRHHILPLYLGGPDVEDNVVWICPNTHAATHEILRECLRLDGKPRWDWLNDYPDMAQRLALRGWLLHVERRQA